MRFLGVVAFYSTFVLQKAFNLQNYKDGKNRCFIIDNLLKIIQLRVARFIKKKKTRPLEFIKAQLKLK